VSITDYPDVYNITFINPPLQTVAVVCTWNTTATNYVSSAAVAQLGSPAIVGYINGLPVGSPINLFELQNVFQSAVSSVLDPNLLTRLVFTVSINGIGTAPLSGTGIVVGDPESYFSTSTTAVSVVQG
jgi:hypothetical protein